MKKRTIAGVAYGQMMKAAVAKTRPTEIATPWGSINLKTALFIPRLGNLRPGLSLLDNLDPGYTFKPGDRIVIQ